MTTTISRLTCPKCGNRNVGLYFGFCLECGAVWSPEPWPPPHDDQAPAKWLEDHPSDFIPYDPWDSPELYRLCERTAEGEQFSF